MAPEADQGGTVRGLLIAVLVLLVLAAATLAARVGGPHSGLDAILAVTATFLDGLPAIALLASGIGLGRLARPIFRESTEPLALQAAVGLSLLLTIVHLLGMSGALGTSVGRTMAIVPCAIGLALGGHQFAAVLRPGARPEALPPAGEVSRTLHPWRFALLLAATPALGVLIAAACNPPGWLWSSEFGGFDALSYHLQLPREWLEMGHVWPVEPRRFPLYFSSCIESAFAYLGWMRGLGGSRATPGPDPAWLMSCQVFHAAFSLIAAWLVSRATAMLVRRHAQNSGTVDGRSGSLAPTIAGGLTLATPWTVVVGSLAYNEMPMVALLAGAMIMAMDSTITAARRGAIAGWLVGIACGVKPTALLFAGLPVGVILVLTTPRAQWRRVLVPATIAGLVALAPWLTRNALACGNPVFPYASSIFGLSHWGSWWQFDRFAKGHSFSGTLLERFQLLVLPEQGEPGSISEHRGMMHAQWGLFFPLTAVAVFIALVRKSRMVLLVTLGLALQIAEWLFTTHLQSRFLIPLIVPSAMLIGYAASVIERHGAWSRTLASAIALAAITAQSSMTAWIFVREQRGRPNALLVPGPGILSGEPWAAQLDSLTPDELQNTLRHASPEVWINLSLPRDAVIYLLGDSTPLYIDRPVVYNTTWDNSLFGEAIRTSPTHPETWNDRVIAHGISYVLLNTSELDRLARSRWLDSDVGSRSAMAWLERMAERVMDWPEQSRTLYRLIPSPPSGAGQ